MEETPSRTRSPSVEYIGERQTGLPVFGERVATAAPPSKARKISPPKQKSALSAAGAPPIRSGQSSTERPSADNRFIAATPIDFERAIQAEHIAATSRFRDMMANSPEAENMLPFVFTPPVIPPGFAEHAGGNVPFENAYDMNNTRAIPNPIGFNDNSATGAFHVSRDNLTSHPGPVAPRSPTDRTASGGKFAKPDKRVARADGVNRARIVPANLPPDRRNPPAGGSSLRTSHRVPVAPLSGTDRPAPGGDFFELSTRVARTSRAQPARIAASANLPPVRPYPPAGGNRFLTLRGAPVAPLSGTDRPAPGGDFSELSTPVARTSRAQPARVAASANLPPDRPNPTAGGDSYSARDGRTSHPAPVVPRSGADRTTPGGHLAMTASGAGRAPRVETLSHGERIRHLESRARSAHPNNLLTRDRSDRANRVRHPGRERGYGVGGNNVVAGCLECLEGTHPDLHEHTLRYLNRTVNSQGLSIFAAHRSINRTFGNVYGSPKNTSGNCVRKPLNYDGCPICLSPFKAGEAIIWCMAGCGKNVHNACFSQWKLHKTTLGLRCVMCNKPWKEDPGPQFYDVMPSGYRSMILGESG